jgi:hopanoid C-3 methylase
MLAAIGWCDISAEGLSPAGRTFPALGARMKVLLVHPSGLMYSEVYLRLEPLGLELIAQAVRKAGQAVRLLDLQACTHSDYFSTLNDWKPDAVGFSVNYLTNVPEVLDLVKETRNRLPNCFLFAGGHSASFIPQQLLSQAAGSLDCVVRGEGEVITPQLLAAAMDDREGIHKLSGIVSSRGTGPAPHMLDNLDTLRPARDLLANRRKYFIGVLDPAVSIEFTRGCPWDCSFCSAWTFYGRSYRKMSPEKAGEDLASIREPGVFIVDDVAFIQPEHGFAIGKEIERRNVKKHYYLETRADVLLRNVEVFRYWKRLGLEYMFLGLEAIDEEGLRLHRKRVTLSKSFEALECARQLGITVAVNIIADPDWDEARFAAVREWALSVPEIVHLTVNTPYPGTETWQTESRQFSTRDYRLFDVQHAVLPTRLPLDSFYRQLVGTQQVLNKKHLGVAALGDTFFLAAKFLAQGQTNFVKMLWKFNKVYNVNRQLRDHQQEVRYEIGLPSVMPGQRILPETLFVHRETLSPASVQAKRPVA